MKTELKLKSILVVGANGALAKETIKQLIHDGADDLVMATRSTSKGQSALNEVLSEVGDSRPKRISVAGGFDMNDPLKIEKAVEKLSEHKPFDLVFLAAGFAVFTDDYQAVDWNGKRIEKNIFQNMMGSHYTLMLLKRKGLLAQGARVVLAGGEGARGIKGMIDKPVFSSPRELRDYLFLNKNPRYNPMNAIGVSKLMGALWTSKISQIEKDNLEVIWFSPGLTSGSAGLNSLPRAKRFMMNTLIAFMGALGKSQNPASGGRKYADALEGKIGENGDLLGAPEGKSLGRITDQTPMNDAFSDQGLIDEFWSILEEIFGAYDRSWKTQASSVVA